VRTLLAIFVLSYASIAAAATHYGHAVPVSIVVHNDGFVDVFFDPATQVSGSPPACTGYSSGALAMRLDSSTAGGQAMLATLLAARANSDPVYYFGSGDCASYAGKETLTQVSVN